MAQDTFLQTQGITKEFGKLRAVNGVSLEIRQGDVHAIIGPNGAGKTSLFNCISGVYKPSEGDILFEDNSILNKRPHQIASFGIARTFQNIELFRHMNVIDNLKVQRSSVLEIQFLSQKGREYRQEIGTR
jgi:branched-chain amino acid transport system ATP-binding protein